jgi:hypothetical protein
MGWNPSRSRRPRRRRPGLAPAAVVAAAAILGVVVGLLLFSCAGELPVPGQTLTTLPGATTTPTTESPAVDLGNRVAATWAEAVQKLVPLLAGSPPPSSLQSPVSQLKEEYVQKLVALGREVEALDPSGRDEAYTRADEALAGMAGTDWYQSYVRLYDGYASATDQTAQDFAVLLSTFNTLIQYSFFDLLRAQDPAEAQRLGLE